MQGPLQQIRSRWLSGQARRGRPGPDPENRRCLVGQRIIGKKTKRSLATDFFWRVGGGFPGMLPTPGPPPGTPPPRTRVGGLPPPKPLRGIWWRQPPNPGDSGEAEPPWEAKKDKTKTHHERAAALGLPGKGPVAPGPHPPRSRRDIRGPSTSGIRIGTARVRP